MVKLQQKRLNQEKRNTHDNKKTKKDKNQREKLTLDEFAQD